MTTAESDVQKLQKDNEFIVEQVKKVEGGEVDVFSGWNHETKLIFEGEDYSVSSSQSSGNHGIRCIRDGRIGFVNGVPAPENQRTVAYS